MLPSSRSLSTLAASIFVAAAAACGASTAPSPGGAPDGSNEGSTSSSSSGGGSSLRWYPTCGPPVVSADCGPGEGGLVDDAGAPCPAVGSSCSQSGALCGTSGPYACPPGVVCESQPMTACPISSKRFKEAIEYLDGPGLQELHDQTMRLRLATYHYKPEVSDPNPKHLGVLVEDLAASSPAVGASGDHLDLYGYLSMVVATIQVQEQEIAELRRQLDESKARHPSPTPPAGRAAR